MSGTPTQAEIETQLQNTVDILESTRNYVDGTLAGAGGKYDTLIQSLEGEYTPQLADLVAAHRAQLDGLLDPGTALAMLEPLYREYAAQVLTDGAGYTELGHTRIPGTIMYAIFELLADALNNNATPRTVQSRNISFDAATSTYTSDGSNSGTIVGSGALSRLTVDEWGYEIEDCTPERKYLRCIKDQMSGVKEHAEVFEVIGDPAAADNIGVTATRQSGAGEVYGSGGRALLYSRHAGTDVTGGSLLTNSSFSEFTSGSPNTMRGWTISSGASTLSQDTTTYFRSYPNATKDASLKATAAFKITQDLSQMGVSELDSTTPYFLRVMYNRSDGSATGTLDLTLGNQAAASVADLSAASSGWQELTYTVDENLYHRLFNEDGFDIEIEWSSAGGTHLLIDDVIFCPWTRIDGTYWVLRGGSTPWKLNDTFKRQDTGGAPSTAKIQYYTQLAGLGYLPHTTGTPSILDP